MPSARSWTPGRLAGQPLGQGARSSASGTRWAPCSPAVQQAHHASYAGPDAVRVRHQGPAGRHCPRRRSALPAIPPARATNLVRLARLRSPDPYPPVARTQQGRDLFAGQTADRRGVEALNRVRAELLLTAGLYSMIPGSCAPECAQIKVPLLSCARGPRHGRSAARGAGQLPRQQRHHAARAALDWARALPVRLASSPVRACGHWCEAIAAE